MPALMQLLMGISIRRYLPAIGTALPAKKAPNQETLRLEVEAIARSIDGKLGVALMGLETGEIFLFNGGDRFPMQSVYKCPLAMAVLERVDKGRLSLGQVVHVAPADLLPDTWSPLRERYPAGNVDIALSELLRVTVSESDNNGCDILFRMLGGPPAVDAYVRGLGIKGMAIAATEEEMHRIAREIHEEVAFVLASDSPEYDIEVRFFSPKREVTFVGHATVAAHYARALTLGVPKGRVRQKSGNWIVEVEVTGRAPNLRVAIHQSPATFGPMVPEERRGPFIRKSTRATSRCHHGSRSRHLMVRPMS